MKEKGMKVLFNTNILLETQTN